MIVILEDFVVPFISVFLAEFGDKSQISLLLLSAKTEKHFKLLLGACMAFLIVDGLAVMAGYYILNLLPLNFIRIAAGLIFMGLGIFYLLKRVSDRKEPARLASPFYSGFVVTFFSEWGDKTQISSALFATKFSPVIVLVAVVFSLFLLSCLTIYIGKHIQRRAGRNLIRKISGFVFIVLGALFILSA